MTRCPACSRITREGAAHQRPGEDVTCDGVRRLRSGEPGAWDAFNALTAESRALDDGDSAMAGRRSGLPPELASAPLDDEPASPEEQAAIDAWRANPNQPTLTHAEVRARIEARFDQQEADNREQEARVLTSDVLASVTAMREEARISDAAQAEYREMLTANAETVLGILREKGIEVVAEPRRPPDVAVLVSATDAVVVPLAPEPVAVVLAPTEETPK